MNRVSKGTTLIEIMVSVILISIVLVFIFNILADLKYEDSIASSRSADAISRASYTRIIQNDFIINKLREISDCGTDDSHICIRFTYDKEFVNNSSTYNHKDLYIYNNYIIYDNEKWSLSYGNYIFNSNKPLINYYYTPRPANASNDFVEYSYLNIYVPVKYNTVSYRKYDFELIYSYDKPLTITGTFNNKIEKRAIDRTTE